MYVTILEKTERFTKIEFNDIVSDISLIATNGAFKLYPGVLTKTITPRIIGKE